MPQYNSAFTGPQIDEAIGDVRTNKAGWSGKADKANVIETTLTSAGWSNNSQTISVPGVKATGIDQLVQIIPAKEYEDLYVDCGVYCAASSADSLQFQCDSVPESDITVHIILTDLNEVN